MAEAADIARGEPRARFFGGGEALLVALAAFYVVALGIWPLGRLLLEAFGPDAAGRPLGLFAEAYGSRAVSRAFWNTLLAASGATAISLVLGGGLALALGLFRLRGRVAMTFLILSPLLIPSQILSLAWIELTGASSPILRLLALAPEPGRTNPLYSAGGVMLLLGIEHMPLVFLAVRAALLGLPQALVEAARMAGARGWRICAAIVLPLLAPAAMAGGALAFAAAVGNFGVPALLGIPGRFTVLTTLIYQRLNGFGPAVLGQVAVLSALLVALAGLALALRAWTTMRAPPIDRAGGPMAPFDPGRWRLPIEIALWAILAIVAILPACALLATAVTPAIGAALTVESATFRHFEAVLASPTIRRAFANSLTLSFAAALIAALAALALAYMAVLRRNRVARLVDLLADGPFIVPGTVLGVAYILVFLRPLPIVEVSIYGTATILLLAYLARFLPLVLRPCAAALASLEPGLDEAGRMVGAGPLRRLAFIVAPLAAPAAMAGAVLVFMTAFNELTVSALLWSSGVETVGVTIFSLQYEGNSTGAAALSVLSILIVLALALALDRARALLPPGTLPWRG